MSEKEQKVVSTDVKKKWWFWALIVIGAFFVIGIVASSGDGGDSSKNNGSENASVPAKETPAESEPDFEPIVLAGQGINVTKSFELSRGKYEVAYKFSNNNSNYGNSGTNFISDIICDNSYTGVFSLTNLIDKAGDGTKIIDISGKDSCYFEVESASKSAKWSFTITKR